MRIVIFANGIMADAARDVAAWTRPGDRVVAADGGSRHALAAGITPELVIGDCDSLPEERMTTLQEAGVEFRRAAADKDETDLELALIWAAEQTDAEDIVVLGAFGGRPDQALANLLLLAHPLLAMSPCPVSMVDGAWKVVLIRGGTKLELRGQAGDRVSLISMGGDAEGVTTTGLAFPLDDEALTLGQARGVSNRLEVESATIRLRKGLLWCFHEHQTLKN